MALAGLCRFAVAKGPFTLDEKAQNMLDAETRSRLMRLHDIVLTWTEWSAEGTDAGLKNFIENEGIGFGKIAPALRAVLSGGYPAPDISRTLAALGREESLSRLNEALFI